MPLAVGDIVALEIIDITYGGHGYARFEDQPVYVAYSIPGEVVNARITRLKGLAAYGSIMNILVAAPQRDVPGCKWFSTCGGCQWQHISYASQLEFKRSIIVRKLSELAGVDDVDVPGPIPARIPWHYRSHITMHRDGNGQFGFIENDGRSIIAVDECPIAHNGLVQAFRTQVPAEFEQLPHLRALSDNTDGAILFSPASTPNTVSEAPSSNHSGSFVNIQLKDRTFRVSSRSFFQANLSQAEQLVKLVVEFANNDQPKGLVLDLYCGVGLFSMFVAGNAERVIAIESNPYGVADARHNLGDFVNVSIREGQVEDELRAIIEPVDLMIVDPPRAGVSALAMKEVVRLFPEQIVYVSCNPATFARDTLRLKKAGYSLVRLQPIDMFPQTFHIELVAYFAR